MSRMIKACIKIATILLFYIISFVSLIRSVSRISYEMVKSAFIIVVLLLFSASALGHLLTGTLGFMKGSIFHDSKINGTDDNFPLYKKYNESNDGALSLDNSTLVKLTDQSNHIVLVKNDPRPSFRRKLYSLFFGK